MDHEEISTNEIFLIDFNYRLYRNQLNSRCQIFGGEPKRTNKGYKIIFNNVGKLRQIFNSYSTENRPAIRFAL